MRDYHWGLVDARIRELSTDVSAERVDRIHATAEYAAAALLADRHLSRHEERSLERVLSASGDFEPDEARMVVRLLRELPDELLEAPPRRWSAALAPWVLDYPPRDGDRAYDYTDIVVTTLSLRWPLPAVPDRRRIRAENLSWTETHLQIGRPVTIESLRIAWGDVETIEPVDPWPELHVEWRRERGEMGAVRIGPKGDVEPFADRIGDLMRAAGAAVSLPDTRARQGWLAAAEVEWEPVDRWPADREAREPSYREASVEPELIVATRGPKGALDGMLRWLASSPASPFRDQIEEALLTDTHLYVRRRKGSIERLPRSALRTRRGGADAVYVFGRRAQALFTDRFTCAVCEQLDGQINASRRGG